MTRIIVSIALFAISTIGVAQTPAEFRHDFSDGVRPWTHENFDAADDKFTFAVFSDLTGVSAAESSRLPSSSSLC